MTKILVVDDNDQNRYMAKVLLTGNGYQVETATNGAEALEAALNEPPDLIIADILMPVMDGYALCRQWKLNNRLKSIPFIFYTATYTDADDEAFGLSLGAERFIVKPVPPDVLTDAVRELLDHSQSETSSPADMAVPSEDVYLRRYNETLIHKLEEKLLQLENTNKALENEIKEHRATENKLSSLEKQLLQSQKMEAIGNLASGIAHDFNNFLMAITGYTEIALIHSRNGGASEKHLQEVLKACDRAKELVNQILTFSRQKDITGKPIQIKAIVEEALTLMQPSLPKQINIYTNLESDALVMASPTQILQVLMNLCTNAVHATDEGGAIAINMTDVELDDDFCVSHCDVTPGSYLKLEVRDDGVGIPQELLPRIFEPYFSTKQMGEGTGLGLSVVHGIIKQIGGLITVQSNPSQGTTFQVFFPVIESEDALDGSCVDLPERGSENVLLVDDEPALVEIVTEFLKELGYNVTVCREGLSALQTFEERPQDFDLVITDITMPGLSGDKLTQKLLAIRPELPVVLCTGFSNTITEKKARQIGSKALLMKPFVMRDLARTMRVVLKK